MKFWRDYELIAFIHGTFFCCNVTQLGMTWCNLNRIMTLQFWRCVAIFFDRALKTISGDNGHFWELFFTIQFLPSVVLFCLFCLFVCSCMLLLSLCLYFNLDKIIFSLKENWILLVMNIACIILCWSNVKFQYIRQRNSSAWLDHAPFITTMKAIEFAWRSLWSWYKRTRKRDPVDMEIIRLHVTLRRRIPVYFKKDTPQEKDYTVSIPRTTWTRGRLCSAMSLGTPFTTVMIPTPFLGLLCSIGLFQRKLSWVLYRHNLPQSRWRVL